MTRGGGSIAGEGSRANDSLRDENIAGRIRTQTTTTATIAGAHFALEPPFWVWECHHWSWLWEAGGRSESYFEQGGGVLTFGIHDLPFESGERDGLRQNPIDRNPLRPGQYDLQRRANAPARTAADEGVASLV